MNNKIKIALLLMIASGNQLFSSAGGGADKYGNTHQGRVTTSSAGGDGGGADETVSTTSAAAGAPNRRSHSHRGASVAQNQVFGNQYFAENIAQYFSPQEATQGLGLINKTSHNATKWQSRFVHAAAITQPIVLRGHTSVVDKLTVLPDGRIVSGSGNHNISGDDYTIRVWDLTKKEDEAGYVQVLRGHEGRLLCFAVLPDGRIVSGSSDRTIRIWNLTQREGEDGYMQVLRTEDWVFSLAVLPNGRIALQSYDRTIQVWDPTKTEGEAGYVQVLSGHEKWVECLAVLSDGRIVSGSHDGTVRVWDLSKREDEADYMRVLRGHDLSVRCLAVFPDDRIVSGSSDCTVRVWDLTKRDDEAGFVRVSREQLYCVEQIALLPNGNIVSRSADPTIRVWDLTKRDDEAGYMRVLIMSESINPITSGVAVFSDGRIVSGSNDRTVRVWDPTKRDDEAGYMRVLRGHEEWVECLAVLSDGRIVSGSWDCTVRVWSSESYFKNKIKRTQDPRDYEIDGPGVYEILFGADGFNRWLKQFFHGRNQIIKDPASNKKNPLFNQEAIENKRAAEEELVEVLKYWFEKNVILVDGVMQPNPNGSVDWKGQAELIIESLRNIKSGTVSQRRFEALGEKNSVQNWRTKLQALIKKTSISAAEAAAAFVQRDNRGGGADAPISAAEAAAALAQRNVVMPGMGNGNIAAPGDEVDNDDDERGQTRCCAQCTAGLRRFLGMNQSK